MAKKNLEVIIFTNQIETVFEKLRIERERPRAVYVIIYITILFHMYTRYRVARNLTENCQHKLDGNKKNGKEGKKRRTREKKICTCFYT